MVYRSTKAQKRLLHRPHPYYSSLWPHAELEMAVLLSGHIIWTY